MTASVTSAAEIALARHSPASLRDLASTLGSYVPDGGTTHEDWVRRVASVWNEPAFAMRLASGLPEPTRNLLAVLAWGPKDRSISTFELARIAKALGHEPGESIASAVAFGAILPVDSSAESLPLATRKALVERGVRELVGVVLWPSLVDRLPAPEVRFSLDQFATESSVRPCEAADMAEWAVRLIALWQAATLTPLRKTQAGGLHKKDRDQLLREPVLAESPAGWPGGAASWAQWFVDAMLPIAVRLGLISDEPEALRPVAVARWSEEAIHLRERFARAVTASLEPLPASSETPAETDDSGTLASWLPAILIAGLANRPAGQWCDLEPLLHAFVSHFAEEERPRERVRLTPATAEANEAVIVRTRGRKKTETAEPARVCTGLIDALRFWIQGPARLAGLVELGTAGDDSIAVRATDLARFLAGEGAPPPSAPVVEKALFLQPNLEGILYRQAVSGQNLPRLATLLRFSGIGPVLQVRLDETWSRRMFAAGLSREEAEARLTAMSAVELSRTVLETYRTWAGKSDRVRIYGSLVLLETQSDEDQANLLELAAARGLRIFPVGARLIAIEDAETIPFDVLRLLAQQDQTQKPAACVRAIEDGTLLEVDTARSDLALEPELARFARPLADAHGASPWSTTTRLYRIDRSTLATARASGMTETWLERFFERRTGGPIPPALRLLWACGVNGSVTCSNASLRIRPTCVIRTESESVLDGLMSLESTAPLIGDRLGPEAAEVALENVDRLKSIVLELGIRLQD